MKILHLSDTHGCHRRLLDLPEADVVVHSGDFTMNGSEAEAIDFMNWLCNVHYLCNSRIEIEGLKFYGVPMLMGDCITDRQSLNYAKIPTDTDVLIILPPTASSITMTASTMARKKFLQDLHRSIVSKPIPYPCTERDK